MLKSSKEGFVLGKNIKQSVEKIVIEDGPISAHTLAQKLGVSRQYIHRVLTSLVDSGVVSKTGVPPKVVYSRASSRNSAAPTQTADRHFPHTVTAQDRAKSLSQKPFVIWFTGLRGSGKTALATELEKRLVAANKHSYLLDEAVFQSGVGKDLGTSAQDASEAVRRAGELAQILRNAGLIVAAAFTSPHASDRNSIRSLIGVDQFIEVFVRCPLEVCEARDKKGIYKNARNGLVGDFVGIDIAYEPPKQPDITIDSQAQRIAKSVDQIWLYLEARGLV